MRTETMFQQVLNFLLMLHVGLYLFRAIPDYDACSTAAFTALSTADFYTVAYRVSKSWHAMVFALESLIMLCIILIVSLQEKLSSLAKVLPTLLLVSALSIRSRHTGIFGCAAGDPECCSNMYCSSAANTVVPSCTLKTAEFKWTNRETYCIQPTWYNTNDCTGGLGAVPDIAKCYENGCSQKNTPLTYYSSRIEFAVVATFAVVCITK